MLDFSEKAGYHHLAYLGECTEIVLAVCESNLRDPLGGGSCVL